MFLSCSTWGRPQLREAWRPRWRGWWSCCLAARGGVHRPSLWRTGKFSFWNMIWVNIEKKQRSWYSQQKVNIEIMIFPTSKDTFSCRPSLGPPSRVPQPQSDIAFELELFLKMFRSQECLFGYDGLVIWYYSPRDELPRYPQSCEGWCELNDESSKESKSWENEELDDLNTTLTSQWTQTLTPNHISTPGILDPAWSGFWGGKKRERAVQDRPRFWAPGSSC